MRRDRFVGFHHARQHRNQSSPAVLVLSVLVGLVWLEKSVQAEKSGEVYRFSSISIGSLSPDIQPPDEETPQRRLLQSTDRTLIPLLTPCEFMYKWYKAPSGGYLTPPGPPDTLDIIAARYTSAAIADKSLNPSHPDWCAWNDITGELTLSNFTMRGRIDDLMAQYIVFAPGTIDAIGKSINATSLLFKKLLANAKNGASTIFNAVQILSQDRYSGRRLNAARSLAIANEATARRLLNAGLTEAARRTALAQQALDVAPPDPGANYVLNTTAPAAVDTYTAMRLASPSGSHRGSSSGGFGPPSAAFLSQTPFSDAKGLVARGRLLGVALTRPVCNVYLDLDALGIHIQPPLGSGTEYLRPLNVSSTAAPTPLPTSGLPGEVPGRSDADVRNAQFTGDEAASPDLKRRSYRLEDVRWTAHLTLSSQVVFSGLTLREVADQVELLLGGWTCTSPPVIGVAPVHVEEFVVRWYLREPEVFLCTLFSPNVGGQPISLFEVTPAQTAETALNERQNQENNRHSLAFQGGNAAHRWPAGWFSPPEVCLHSTFYKTKGLTPVQPSAYSPLQAEAFGSVALECPSLSYNKTGTEGQLRFVPQPATLIVDQQGQRAEVRLGGPPVPGAADDLLWAVWHDALSGVSFSLVPEDVTLAKATAHSGGSVEDMGDFLITVEHGVATQSPVVFAYQWRGRLASSGPAQSLLALATDRLNIDFQISPASLFFTSPLRVGTNATLPYTCWQGSTKSWIEELVGLVLDPGSLVLISSPAFLQAPGSPEDETNSGDEIDVLVPRRINFDPRFQVAEFTTEDPTPTNTPDATPPSPTPSLDKVLNTPVFPTHQQVQPVSSTDWSEMVRGLLRVPLPVVLGGGGSKVATPPLRLPVRSRLRSVLGLVYGGLHYGPGVVLTDEGTDGVVPAVFLASGATKLLPEYVVELLSIVEKAKGLVETAIYIFRDPLITGEEIEGDSGGEGLFPFSTCWNNAQMKRTSNSSDGTIRYGAGSVTCGWVRRLDPLTWHNDIALREDPETRLQPARTFPRELDTLAALAEQVQAEASRPIELIHDSAKTLEKDVQDVTTQAKSAISINNALRDKLLESDEATRKWRDSINSAFSAGRVVSLTIKEIQQQFPCETRYVFSVACPGAGADIVYFGLLLFLVVATYTALLYLCMGKKLLE
jgi:hypothetical protein